MGTILKGQFGELKHFCKTCNKGFSLKSRLINHRRSHTGEKPYKCNICKKTFSHGGSLTYHKRIHSGEKPYKCLECGKSFSQPGHLTSHSVLHTKKYKCSLCTKTFTREEILERHMTTHNDNLKVQPTSCEHCGRMFRCKKNLLKHLRKYCAKLHGYKCLKCGNVFSSDEELFIHRQIHSKSHQCKICLKYFNRPSSLQAHKLRYRGRCIDPSVNPKTLMENLRCRNCGKLFSHMRSLTKHVRRYCGQDNELMCKRCGKVFPSVAVLEVHKKIHNKVKYHQCEVCQLSFRRPGLLRVHRVIHGSCKEEQKDGEGSIEKTTNSKGSKKRKTRTKKVKAKKYCIKEFLQCMNCGKVCSSIEDLENHSDEHSLGKPHKCDICLKRFFRPVRLQAHKSSFVDGHNKGKRHQPVRVKVKVLVQGSSPVDSDLEGNIDRECDQDGYHFQCEFCHKIFKREGLLRKHQLTNDSCRSEKNSLDETSDENSAVDSDSDLETSTSDISNLWETMKEDHFKSSLRENPEFENSTSKSLNVEGSTIVESFNESKTKGTTGLKSWKHQCEVCFKKFRQPEMLNTHKLSCVESGIQKSGIEGSIDNKSKLDDSVKEKTVYQESISENIDLEESMTYNLNPEESMTDKPHLAESMTDKPHLEESVTDKPHLEGIVKDKANAETSKLDEPDHGDGMQKDFTGAEEPSLEHIFECFDCGKVCSSFDALDKHGEEHSKKKPHKCDVCLRRFMRPGRLLAHKLSYRQGDKKGKPHIPWKMKIRPDTDKTKNPHSVVYVNETPDFQGSINELPLEGTVIEMHDVEDSRNKMVDLEDAIKEIPDTMTGTSNLKRGNLGNLHMCELCGKCYPNKSSLKNHRRTHTGEKPYMCDLCGHFFTTGSGLKIHRLSHSGIKNFKCEQCNKSFVSSHNLQCHLLVHNRPKSFICKICGRVCKLLSNLNRHMTTHK